MGEYSRKDVKKLIREKQILVSGKPAVSSDLKCDPDKDEITVCGKPFSYARFVYLMMNKPAGVVSATRDGADRTVLDLLPAKYRKREVFPVGRLDKDTEGLLLITDDGVLAHKLLAPKNHIDKEYFVRVEGRLEEEHIVAFREGLVLSDGYQCMDAELKILSLNEHTEPVSSEALVVIREGKFHQIKKMFGVLGKPVLYLKRIRMGDLNLDRELECGDSRPLTEEELKGLSDLVG